MFLGDATVSEWIWVCMFFRGGNCVRMDMGKVLSNKIITVTDTCLV